MKHPRCDDVRAACRQDEVSSCLSDKIVNEGFPVDRIRPGFGIGKIGRPHLFRRRSASLLRTDAVDFGIQCRKSDAHLRRGCLSLAVVIKGS